MTLEDSVSFRVPAQMPHLSVRYIMQERKVCMRLHACHISGHHRTGKEDSDLSTGQAAYIDGAQDDKCQDIFIFQIE